MPWRRLASSAAGERHEVEQRARRVGLRRRGADAAGEGGDDLRAPAASGRARRCRRGASARSAAGSRARPRRARPARPPARPAAPARARSRSCSAMPQRSKSCVQRARRSARWNSRRVRAASTASRNASSVPMSGRGAPRAHRDRDGRAHQVGLAAGDDAAGRDQLVDRVGGQHHDVEALAGLHPLGRIDAADRFERDLAAAALLARRRRARPAPGASPSTRCR